LDAKGLVSDNYKWLCRFRKLWFERRKM